MKIRSRHEWLDVEAGDLFADPAFVEWLNSQVGKGLATWHCGGKPHDMSDTFVIYDRGEGPECSDNPGGMPEHCWKAICEMCDRAGFEYGIVRLLNQEPGDDEEDHLVELAYEHKLDTLSLCQALDIHHDRTNNGGVREVIQIALEDDDPEWIEGRILSAKKGKQ
jgi:hypothetical protein